MRELTAPQLQKVAQYFPENYEAIIAGGGPSVPTESGAGREMQGKTLADLYDISREGLPLGLKLAAKESSYRLANEAGRGQDAIRNELAMRGRLGGGREAALRAVGGQQAANLARSMGADLSQQEINARMGALGAASTGAGVQRGQDIQLGTAKADAVNRFNEMVSNLRTQAARDAMGERVRAQVANQDLTQNLSERNALLNYGNDESNLNRLNALRQQTFGNQVSKAEGMTGALKQKAAGKDARQAAIAETAQSAGRAFGGALGGIFDMGGSLVGGGGGTSAASGASSAAPDLFSPFTRNTNLLYGPMESYF
jgi:hypothetical protein